MPDPIPTDDLYARLGVPMDADAPAIDRAWRTLLKQHHPDIAGSLSLELAKLINVAHDWLRDADRRARYDEAVRRREGRRSTGGPSWRPSTARAGRSRPEPTKRPGSPNPSARRPSQRARPSPSAAPPDDLDEAFGASAPAIRSFLAQASALTRTDVDRLQVTEPVDPVADLRDIIPPELWTRIGLIDQRLADVARGPLSGDARAATAARAYGHAVVLELFLWYYLADPEQLLEGMRRGWESAVGLPRYGPNTGEVTALIARLYAGGPTLAAELASAWDGLGDPQPWPADAWEFDFAALEVSAALARRDAAAAIGSPSEPSSAELPADSIRSRNAFASTAHVATLRPIFPPRAYARYQAALALLRDGAGRRVVGQAPRPIVRRA